MTPVHHPSLWMESLRLIKSRHFIIFFFVLVSFGVERADALAVPRSWGTKGGLLRRAAAGGPPANPGMSRQAAHGLAIALIILAMLIGVVFFAHRSQQWHRQRHGAPSASIAPFLRNRPSWGSIPVVMSPRTAAMVAQNPATYASPSTEHGVPHWATRHFPSVAPLSPPPPAYSPLIATHGYSGQRV